MAISQIKPGGQPNQSRLLFWLLSCQSQKSMSFSFSLTPMVLYSEFSMFSLPVSSLNTSRPDRYGFLNLPCIWLTITHSLRFGLFIYEVFHTTRNVNSQGNARSCTCGDDGGEKQNNVAGSWQDGCNLSGSTCRLLGHSPSPPENRVREWSSAGGKELMIWRCEKTENFQRTGPADWRGECGGNKWVSDFQLRLCHHLQGEPILCLLWKRHANARFTSVPGCARLQKQSPFIRLPAMSTWVQPLESVHHHEVWMCLWIWEKHIQPAASVHISGHIHHCKCLGGGECSVLFFYSLGSKGMS